MAGPESQNPGEPGGNCGESAAMHAPQTGPEPKYMSRADLEAYMANLPVSGQSGQRMSPRDLANFFAETLPCIRATNRAIAEHGFNAKLEQSCDANQLQTLAQFLRRLETLTAESIVAFGHSAQLVEGTPSVLGILRQIDDLPPGGTGKSASLEQVNFAASVSLSLTLHLVSFSGLVRRFDEKTLQQLSDTVRLLHLLTRRGMRTMETVEGVLRLAATYRTGIYRSTHEYVLLECKAVVDMLTASAIPKQFVESDGFCHEDDLPIDGGKLEASISSCDLQPFHDFPGTSCVAPNKGLYVLLEEEYLAALALLDAEPGVEQSRVDEPQDAAHDDPQAKSADESGLSIERPPERAIIAWRLQILMGINKQTQIAAAMTQQGHLATQGQVSKWLRQVEGYLAAGGVLPALDAMRKPDTVDPAVIEMGARRDRLTPRQRLRRDPDSDSES